MTTVAAIGLALVGLALWGALASGLAYLLFAMDKRNAERGDWRIPEGRLLALAMIGGWPGAKLAQRRLRHKTRKEPFRSQLNLVAVVPVLIVAFVIACAVAVAQGQLHLPGQAGFATLLQRMTTAEPDLPRRFGPGS